MAQTGDVTEIVDAIIRYLEEPDLGLLKVYWGDQRLVPEAPCAAVEPTLATRVFNETGLKVNVNFNIAILLYCAKLGRVEENRREASVLARNVVNKFDLTRTLGGLVVDGQVTNIEAGFGVRTAALFRIVRLTWEGFSQVILPPKTGA